MLRLDVKRQLGHNAIEIDLASGSETYFTLQARGGVEAAAMFGALGMIERATAESANNGIFEIVEISQQQATQIFSRCNFVGRISPLETTSD